MATSFDHVDATSNLSDIAQDAYEVSRRRRPNGAVNESDDYSLYLAGGCLFVGFVLGYFVGAHRTELVRPWR